MSKDPNTLRAEWMNLRETEKGLHALDFAERLSVSEAELVASVCSAEGAITSTRITTRDWPALIGKLPTLGTVKTITRNPQAVIEVDGTYDNIEFFGAMGQSVSSIDLRIFSSRWSVGFAVRDQTKRGLSQSLQFFDAFGRAVHKLYLREASDQAAFDAIVSAHLADDQSQAQTVEAKDAPATTKADADVDVSGLQNAWRGMTNTHEFFGLLREYGVARTQALRLASGDLAWPVQKESLEQILQAAAGTDLQLMVFVGNPGMLQIFSGAIKKIAVMEPWVNILDPRFNLHVRRDLIAHAYVVRKPTADGDVTSLEFYAADGEQIAYLVGKRKPGEQENETWRALVRSLPRASA